MLAFAKRLIFVIATTAIIVFFSEKSYWYVHGYVISELILYYGIAMFAALWAMKYFKVSHVLTVYLAGAIMGTIVEAAVVWAIYEDGLFGWFMPLYTALGLHAVFSVTFGWYYIRKLLLGGRVFYLLLWPALYGIWWGFWSTYQWFAENEGDEFLVLSVQDFALYAITFTCMLIVGHIIIDRFWQSEFNITKVEKWILGCAVAGLFIYQAINVQILIIKGIVIFGTILLLLKQSANRVAIETQDVFKQLEGQVRPTRIIALLLIPIFAIGTYAIMTYIQPSQAFIQEVSINGLTLLLTITGFVFLVRSIKHSLSGKKAT
jgi:hypothetical protein